MQSEGWVISIAISPHVHSSAVVQQSTQAEG